VLLNAISQFRRARTQEDYENALTIFRNCLINHYEHMALGMNANKQSRRIGNDPPTNMDTVQDSFRNATLLPRTIERTKVWRVSARYPLPDLGRKAWLEARPFRLPLATNWMGCWNSVWTRLRKVSTPLDAQRSILPLLTVQHYARMDLVGPSSGLERSTIAFALNAIGSMPARRTYPSFLLRNSSLWLRNARE